MRHWKKLILALLVVEVLLISVLCAGANPGDKIVVFQIGYSKYLVNTGSGYTATAMDVKPYIRNSRTYVPVRYLGEALGASVNWDAATRTATLVKDNTRVDLVIGNKTGKVNNGDLVMDVAPEINSGRTMLPARYVAESFGYQVTWDAANKLVICKTGDITVDIQEILKKIRELPDKQPPKPGQLIWHNDGVEKAAKTLESKGYKVRLGHPFFDYSQATLYYNDYGSAYVEGHFKSPSWKQWEKDVYQAIKEFVGKEGADEIQIRFDILNHPHTYIVNYVYNAGNKAVEVLRGDYEYDPAVDAEVLTDTVYVIFRCDLPK